MINSRLTLILLLMLFIVPPVKTSYSNPKRKEILTVSNITQCFETINETTLEKKEFYYNDLHTMEQCNKLALGLKYKEDIFFPKYFHKCFPLCNSCYEYSQEKANMKCISCLNGFLLTNGNCYINQKYNPKKRTDELNKIFNTLNLNPEIKSNEIIKKYINGETYLFKNTPKNDKRRLYIIDDYDDTSNAIFDREDQSILTDNKSEIAYNFRIELSPFFILAKICIEKGKYFIENNTCVDQCTPHFEYYYGYPEIKIPVGPNNEVIVCDCGFRCCVKRINYLYKSLDRGFTDGSYHYFRRKDGRCLLYTERYEDINRENTYLLAQDFVPCFFPVYNDRGEIEFYISGYGKTAIGNNCVNLCPVERRKKVYYYYDPATSGCYECPENCIECDGIPTEENGHCVKCDKYYNGILNGFCLVLCPSDYGEKNGIKWLCQKCDDNEIKFDNKCMVDEGPSHNYGTTSNPSYPDQSNNKLYHACLEYVSFKNYIYNTDSSLCPSITCPDGFYNKDGICNICPDGCSTCYEDTSGNIKCSTCDDDYQMGSFGARCDPCFFIYQGSCQEECNAFIRYTDNSIECLETCDYPLIKRSGNICDDKCEGEDMSYIAPENLCLEECSIYFPESIDGRCGNCLLLGLINFNGSCVRLGDNFDEIYYIIPGKEEEYEKYGIVGSCYIIDELGDYHPEHIISRQKDPSLCPDDCPSNFIKKYDSNGEIYCTKCYETCQTCDYTGEQGNHKCTSCKEGYEPSTRMYAICDQICSPGEFFYYEDTREKKCSDICPDEKPYMAEPEDENQPNIECIGNCTDNEQFLMNNTFNCVKKCPEGYFLANKLICVDKCEEGTGYIRDDKECKNCTEYSLYSYDGKCYNASEEIPLDTYIETITEPDPNDENNNNNDNPIPGENDDGTFHYCFSEYNDGFKTGYFEKYQNCSQACPEGYTYDTSSTMCKKCNEGPDCPYCDPENGCTFMCPDDYLSIMGLGAGGFTCIKTCPDERPIFNGFSCTDSCSMPGEKILPTYNGDNKVMECKPINCKDFNLYYYPETNVCYDTYTIPDNSYYDPNNQNPEESTLSPCLIKISHLEYTTGFFFTLSNCKIQCPEYYYYAGNNKCKKCHPLCKSCTGEGTNSENNCLSCIDTTNRVLNPITYNCEKKCNSSFHFDSNYNMVCDEKCEKDNFIDEISGKCITECDKLIDGNYCVNECPEDKIEFNGYCLKDVSIPVIIKTIIITDKDNQSSNSNNPSENNENTNNEKNDNDNNDNNKDNNENNDNNDNNKDNNDNNNDNNDNNKDNNDNENRDNNNENENNKSNENKENINRNIDIIELIRILERNLTQYIYTNFIFNNKNLVNQDNNNNFKIFQTKDGNLSLSEIYLNSSFLNFGNSFNIFYLSELITKLKEYYPSEQSLYIMQIDLNQKKTENSQEKINYPLPKYKIFLTTGEEINIADMFPDIEIIIEREMKFEKKLEDNNKLAYDLINQGINIFDINDPFFTDMCYSYQDEHGNDVTLKNRKEDYYQNILVCSDGCEYMGINTTDSTNYKIICKCKISSLMINNSTGIYDYNSNNSNDIAKYDNKENNIISEVVKCTEDIAKTDEVKKNVGLWVYLGFLCLLIGLYLCYCCYDFDSLYALLYPFSKNKKEEKSEEIIEEEIIQKKEVINSNKTENPKEEIKSKKIVKYNNKKNPPKKYKITFNDDKKEYPKLNISNFGKEGFKLSNKFEKLNLDTISDVDDSQEKDKSNNNNYSSPRNNSLSNSNSGNNSPSSDSSFNFSRKFSPRQVDLDPEGALLDTNNFFDTCKVVKIPSRFSSQEINERNEAKSNTITLNNNIRNSNFFQKKKRTVKLPGFPNLKIERNDDNEGGNDNPINRKNTRNENMEYDLKKEIYEREIKNIDNLSDFDSKEKNGVYHKYKKARYPFRNRSSLMNSYTSETFSQQPITINKYYITNNTAEDIYNRKDSQDKSKSKKNNYLTNSNQSGEKTVTIKRKKIKTNKSYFYEYLFKYNIDFADFEDVLLYDIRSFCQIYISLISNFQIFLSIILGGGSAKVFIPLCVRGAIAVFTMVLYFTGIAIFINFSTLEKRYKFNKSIDIIYLIKNESSSIIYTSLISKIMNIVTMYFLVHYSINKIIKEYAFKENLFLQKIKNEIKCLKCKYHIFFIICIILTILQGYYISCFCGVFKGAIKPWIFSALITFGLNLIMSFVIILISTILRKIALNCQSWIVFLFSKLVLLFA